MADNDPRQEYLVRCIKTLCCLDEVQVDKLLSTGNPEFGSFLNNASSRVLQVSVFADSQGEEKQDVDENGPPEKVQVRLSNTLEKVDWDRCSAEMHFIKTSLEDLTEENISKNVIVTSMRQSPITSLYHALHTVYAPTLLNNSTWTTVLDHKTQTLLNDLDSGLGTAVRGGGGVASTEPMQSSHRKGSNASSKPDPVLSVHGIWTPLDEIRFWEDQVAQGGRGRTRAQKFSECFERIREDCTKLSSSDLGSSTSNEVASSNALSLGQLYDILDNVHSVLDDLWKNPDLYDEADQYPEFRMEHFFGVFGAAICRHIQSALRPLDLWYGQIDVKVALEESIRICEHWVSCTNELTGKLWWNYPEHKWTGEVYEDEMVRNCIRRLEDILRIRATHQELLRLLPNNQQTQNVSAFKAFESLDPLQYNTYTQPLWLRAMATYERTLAPIEEKVAKVIRSKLSSVGSSSARSGRRRGSVDEDSTFHAVHALIRVYYQFRQLISRPSIAKSLVSEREKFLSLIMTFLEAIDNEVDVRCNEGFDDVAHKRRGETAVDASRASKVLGKHMSPCVAAITWARQVAYRVESTVASVSPVLSDLSAYSRLEEFAQNLQQRIEAFQSDTFRDWCHDTEDQLADGELSLQLTGKLMQIDHEGLLQVNYSERLVTLLREVRQLSELSFTVPLKIKKASAEAEKYYRFGVMLKKTANYYNQMESQIIPNQKAMLYEALVNFESEVNNPRSSGGHAKDGSSTTVTWREPSECELFVQRLREATDRLNTENRKLRKAHERVGDEVVALMNIDLLRQRDLWKRHWKNLQSMVHVLEGQYEPKRMQKWKLHWDQQLYKSLEASYRMGLESLNHNLAEIKAELAFSNRKVQFRPPLEELRTAYYREMRKFVAMPAGFTGLGENRELFRKMANRNGTGLHQVFQKAENLFDRLGELQQSLEPYMILGMVNDLDALVAAECTKAEHWEVNFKMLKTKRREMDKLPDFHKVDCFSISTTNLKGALEEQLQRLDDALVLSLRKSVLLSLREVEQNLDQSMAKLRARPDSIEEIANAQEAWHEVSKMKEPWKRKWDRCEESRKLLLTVASNSQVDVSEVMNLHGRLPSKWENFEVSLIAFNDMIEDQRQTLKARVDSDIERSQKELRGFTERWRTLKPSDITDWSEVAVENIFSNLEEWREQFEVLLKTIHSTFKSCEHFEMEAPIYEGLAELEADVEAVENEWNQYKQFSSELGELKKKDWITFRTSLYDAEDLSKKWIESMKGKARGEVLDQIKKTCDLIRMSMPALKFMRGEPFKEEHWTKLVRKLGMPRGTDLQRLTFGHFVDVIDKVHANLQFAKDMTARAQGEVTIRDAIMELKAWSETVTVEMMDHVEMNRNTPLVKNWKDILLELGDNQSLLASLKESQYYKPFEKEASVYESNMAALDEYLMHMNQIQRKWLYLEPIFGRGALPSEQSRFRRVDDEWTEMMNKLNTEPLLFNLCDDGMFPRMQETLHMMVEQLERCQKALADFLEEKRSKMPRFYFIGDDDLLEILGQSRNPAVIQSHLKKLFQGIHSVVFDEGARNITAIRSSAGEQVDLEAPVEVSDDVEVWLKHLNDEMKGTLQRLVVRCVHHDAKDPESGDPMEVYPSQVLCLAESIKFTSRCEHAIAKGKLPALKKLLNRTLQSHISMLSDRSDSPLLQLKLKALVLDVVHHIDVLNQLIEANVTRLEEWQWDKQLRYYLQGSNVCVCRMCNAEMEYTYEYWGNAPKLVHTPLTDKCFLTLTQGMHMGFGGSPYGPAGTGKTESVKALGGCLGRQVLVFNCDEGIDFQSMGRIFAGLVKCGAWGCFDEFNRLKEDQLSAVSQQIQVIQAAIKERNPCIRLLNKDIDVDFNAGIFVTMNPAGKGYGGRSKLPDNLKQLFRPVAMSRPDNNLIAEVILYSEGFQEAKDLGKKMVSLYQLSKELLSPQQHYDWGLRAMKAVLNTGGKLIQRAKLEKVKNGMDSTLDVEIEREILIKAVRVNTLSKLTYADSQLFLGLIGDVFPQANSNDVEYVELEQAIREVMCNPPFNLEYSETQVRKMLQLKESLDQRMGCVIVGPSGCGKSTLWKVLKGALNHLASKKTAAAAASAGTVAVKTYVMNPKSMPRERLLGHMDLDTREWTDGVLTMAARQVVKEPLEVTSWIVCDGDVDPEWIESLNSVLDDNKLLTMPNGERISFGPNVNFLFETHDLKYASPATISRMGMIFLSDQDVDVERLVKCWLREQNERAKRSESKASKKKRKASIRNDEEKENLEDPNATQNDDEMPQIGLLKQWIGDYFYRALDWVLRQNAFVVETTMVGTVKSGLSHIQYAETKSDFVVGLIRGLGGNLNLATRKAFAKEVFTLTNENPIDSASPLDCYSDRGSLVSYQAGDHLHGKFDDLVSNSGSSTVVHTVSVQRNLDMIKAWVEHMEPFILVGPEGCGKNMILRHCFESAGKATSVTTLHCNAQTTASHVIQKITQSCSLFSTNSGRVFRPRDSERLVLYLKDINLPKPDKYDTCMLIAFLQQLITFHGFYDENLEFLGLERVHIVASMNPSSTVGRHPLSTRFTAIVRVAFIDYPDTRELSAVFGVILESAVSGPSSSRALLSDDGSSGTRSIRLEVSDAKWKSPSNLLKLSETMVEIYNSVRSKFSVDEHRHYQFTPRDITQWIVGMLRYDTKSEDLLDVVAYEARRLFRDRLIDSESETKFDNILTSSLRKDWNHRLDQLSDCYYSSLTGGIGSVALNAEGKEGDTSSGGESRTAICGAALERVCSRDFVALVENGITMYEREEKELHIKLFPEVLDHVARVDRVISKAGGAMLLVGSCGVGRRTATTLVAHMRGIQFVTPTVVHGTGPEAVEVARKAFVTDLKRAMQTTGVEGESAILYIEDHQIVSEELLETINSLLSSGEVPGLYKHEELVPLLEPLRDVMQDVGGFRTPYDFFVHRVQQNLHIVISMDPRNSSFQARCQSNPALFTKCSIQWMGEWRSTSMHLVPGLLLPEHFGQSSQTAADDLEGGEGKGGDDDSDEDAFRGRDMDDSDEEGEGKHSTPKQQSKPRRNSVHVKDAQLVSPETLKDYAIAIHTSCLGRGATPRDFVAFLHCYEQLYEEKAGALKKRVSNFLGGLSKLREAAHTVDELSAQADEQRVLLQQKQKQADRSMDEITEALQQASTTKKETEELSLDLRQAEEETLARKGAIESELSEITPILEEAQEAVGNIRSEHLNEIRAFKMPPEPIKDVLSAVLMLLGVEDTSWTGMRAFLGGHGVKNNILNFDAHNITNDIRKKVSRILKNKASSFDKRTIARVSAAAAPMASWVKANIRYSMVLEKIQPLEEELNEAKKQLVASQERLNDCERELEEIDQRVKTLQENFKQLTREAETLNIKVQDTEQTLEKAHNLLGQLSGEQQRWEIQAKELNGVMETLALQMLLTAAFTTYLGKTPEDVRQATLGDWKQLVSHGCRTQGGQFNEDGVIKFDYKSIMSSESQMLVWKQQGLAGDELSMENAMIILHAGENNSNRCPFIIDPANTAAKWLKRCLESQHDSRGSPVELVAQQDPRFVNHVELAVRFGKTLIVTEVDQVEPILFPIIRRDLKHQGPRWVVHIGDKLIDYNEKFRLYLVTRNPEPYIPPDAAALITEVNFTITRSGLEGQLLGVTVHHEQPELEKEKSEMLKREEEFRVQLADLEKELLDTLAESEGNLLENQALLDTLTKTKGKSAEVAASLNASARASETLDEQRNQYRPFAKAGSDLFFAISALSNMNHMYQFSLQSFIHLFRSALGENMNHNGIEDRTTKLAESLEVKVLHFVGRSLFKADRQMFAMHLVHEIHPEQFAPDEWEFFIGDIVLSNDTSGRGEQLPGWVSSDRAATFELFQHTFKRMLNLIQLNGSQAQTWERWGRNPECEKFFPPDIRLSPFQRVILVQTLRPDRLQSAMAHFCCQVMAIETLSPPAMSIGHLYESNTANESSSNEKGNTSGPVPVLMITTPGADPCRELEECAAQVVGKDHYIEIAMGGGQTESALSMLRDAARVGDWLCLKNLHLVTGWLPRLEKEVSTLECHPNFRLWMTTEESGKFSPILLQQSLKVTFESPPGVKKNLERTYESWPEEVVEKGGAARAQLLFVLALFHAIVQERRTYIPQGWTKFYEFSTGDLRSGTGVVELASHALKAGGEVDWDYIRGLMENSVYGGRVDNPFDLRVLRTYLQEYFTDNALEGRAEMGRSGIALPKPSASREHYLSWVERNLEDEDGPLMFGLPPNIERSVQRAMSTGTINALRALSKHTAHSNKFDREKWRQLLEPFLSLWEKLTESSPNALAKPTNTSGSEDGARDPVAHFVLLEESRAYTMVRKVDRALGHLKMVVNGSGLLTPTIQEHAQSLMKGEVPDDWMRMWEEGSELPKAWLKGLVSRKVALRTWAKQVGKGSLLERSNDQPLDLSELFNPGTFLNALRQQTARISRCSMDNLRMRCSWRGVHSSSMKLPVTISGLLLQGAEFDGKQLIESEADAAEMVAAPDCVIGFVVDGDDEEQDDAGLLSVPLYYNTSRERVLVELDLPCESEEEKNTWITGGVALFLV